MVGVVFMAIMFEVTVLLIFLSVRSHEVSLSSLLVLVEGFSFGPDWLDVSMLLITIPNHLLLWGLLGLKHFVSLRIISLGYGFVHVTDVCAMGYDGCYAKGLA
jgi:hypothetical protein